MRTHLWIQRAVLLATAVWLPGTMLTTAQEPHGKAEWEIGRPIVTYWAGPAMTDATAKQMAEGGWNLVWCQEHELDVAQRHGLRAMLHAPGLINPAALADPAKQKQLDALIDRVASHPALYCYYIVDEPNAAAFPALGKLVDYLRSRDPGHLAYINLFPTYASNAQLGTQGDTVTAYRAHVQQFVEIVKPDLISYDHYQFATDGDREGYFLNLALIRAAAQDAGVPFLNIVQACSWTPSRRVPQGDEMRYLLYTTLAYGGQGISYYVYCHPGHTGGIAQPDGSPTPLYHALQSLNREFAAIAGQLMALQSVGVYHLGMMPAGAVAPPAEAPFRLDPAVPKMTYQPPERVRGVVLGLFGASRAPAQATHVLVVNLDYQRPLDTTLVGPGQIDSFDPTSGRWSAAGRDRAALELPPGGGQLLRRLPIDAHDAGHRSIRRPARVAAVTDSVHSRHHATLNSRQRGGHE